jgi:PPP family 3-phenylpropionic acid transporter
MYAGRCYPSLRAGARSRTIALDRVQPFARRSPGTDHQSLRRARPAALFPGQPPSARFEYGWVRGAGSAAFVAGTLLSGQVVHLLGLAAALATQGGLLLGAACITIFVPATPVRRFATSKHADRAQRAALLINGSYRYLVCAAALILGSHAMHDAFAMIAWNAAGISSTTGSILWSTAVCAEIVVFFLVGPWLLRKTTPSMAMAIAAVGAAVRWLVMSQSPTVAVLALIQPLHGLTFALLHLACMSIIVRVTPNSLAATAQAIYALGIAAASAVLTFLSGYLYAFFGVSGFAFMSLLPLTALPVIWLLSRSLRGRETR